MVVHVAGGFEGRGEIRRRLAGWEATAGGETVTSTTMQIEYPACAGQRGAGTYCEDCDCTGMVYVPECVADELATVRELADMAQAALAAMTTRAERAERLLEDLTPGGSEFHGSPARCAEFVRNRMAGVIEQVKLRQAAEAKLETAITRAGQFEARLDDAQMDIARLCGLLRGVRYVNTVGDIQRLVRACEAVEARWGIEPQAVQP